MFWLRFACYITMTSPAFNFPDFDDLLATATEDQPQGCLWGYFDRDGRKDEIGSKFTVDMVFDCYSYR